MMKFCKYCNAEFDINGDHWYKSGHKVRCKIKKLEYVRINKERISKYYRDNKEHIVQKKIEYYQNNKNQILEKNTNYWENNKRKIMIKQLKWRNHYRKININFRLACLLRSRQNAILKGKTKVGSFIRDLGCSVDFLRQYLESKFTPEMTWANQGSYWHLDHILPLSKFDLTNREQFLKVCHYTNLQPLEAKENLKKGNKILET